MAGRPGFPESPGRFCRGVGHATQADQFFSEIDVGRIEAGGPLYGRRGRGNIVDHPVRAGQGRRPGALWIGAGGLPLDQRWSFFGIFGMGLQLVGAMPVVRGVADPGGSFHGGGLGVALFQRPSVCASSRPFRFRPESSRPVGVAGASHLPGKHVRACLRWRRLSPCPPWPEHWISSRHGKGREPARPRRRQAGLSL